MTTKRLSPALLTLTLLGTLTACGERPLAYGDANSIIAVMPADKWDEVSEAVYTALEPTIVTVREEKTFTVTYQEPYGDFWDRLRRFRQMVVVGTPEDPWVQEIMESSRKPIEADGMYQVYDVWSDGQTVTLLLLEPGWGLADLEPYLPRINELLDGQYRAFARNRMYFSGADSALADTLSMRAGFSMLLPDVYRWQVKDSTYIFRNDNPDPSELIRQISVSWRTPAPGTLDRDQTLAWRHQVVDQYYSEPQDVALDESGERTFPSPSGSVYELQAMWRNPPERSWPAGGPMTVRTLTCDAQDRTYLLDAWLYAPGKEKYEYMIQLETLLDSFRCTS